MWIMWCYSKFTWFIRKYADLWILFVILMVGVLAFCGSPLVPACAAVSTIGSCNKKEKERLINLLNMK